MLAIGLDGKLPNFRIDLDRMDGAIDLVLDTTRNAYPSFDVPFHSRWRHFVSNGDDRWAAVAGHASWPDRAARARAEFDLAIVSVFLDAGAGPSWRYRDPGTGSAIGRSEGLGLASLAMFTDGVFSAAPSEPLRADADKLANLDVAVLARGMQVSELNPLVGLDGRTDLLRRLGKLVASKPDIFGSRDMPRPGGLYDRLAMLADGGKLPAPTILTELLQQLGPIWPSRLTLGGIALGDCWRHPALTTADATSGLVPLHKLSQWLAYSLIEPLQTIRHRRHRYRRPHWPRGISQRRAVHRYRRAWVSRCRCGAAGTRGRFAAGRGMARADGGAARPRRRWRAAAAWTRRHVDAAGENSRGRHLGCGPAAGARAPRGRLASGESHQRRHGFLDPRSWTWTALRSLATRWCSTS